MHSLVASGVNTNTAARSGEGMEFTRVLVEGWSPRVLAAAFSDDEEDSTDEVKATCSENDMGEHRGTEKGACFSHHETTPRPRQALGQDGHHNKPISAFKPIDVNGHEDTQSPDCSPLKPVSVTVPMPTFSSKHEAVNSGKVESRVGVFAATGGIKLGARKTKGLVPDTTYSSKEDSSNPADVGQDDPLPNLFCVGTMPCRRMKLGDRKLKRMDATSREVPIEDTWPASALAEQPAVQVGAVPAQGKKLGDRKIKRMDPNSKEVPSEDTWPASDLAEQPEVQVGAMPGQGKKLGDRQIKRME